MKEKTRREKKQDKRRDKMKKKIEERREDAKKKLFCNFFPKPKRQFFQKTKATHDADSSSCFDEAPEDEPESWVDYMKKDTHKVDELVRANRNTSWFLRVRQIYGRQATIIAKHHKDRLDQTRLQLEPNKDQPSKKVTANKQGRQVGRTTSQRTTTSGATSLGLPQRKTL